MKNTHTKTESSAQQRKKKVKDDRAVLKRENKERMTTNLAVAQPRQLQLLPGAELVTSCGCLDPNDRLCTRAQAHTPRVLRSENKEVKKQAEGNLQRQPSRSTVEADASEVPLLM